MASWQDVTNIAETSSGTLYKLQEGAQLRLRSGSPDAVLAKIGKNRFGKKVLMWQVAVKLPDSARVWPCEFSMTQLSDLVKKDAFLEDAPTVQGWGRVLTVAKVHLKRGFTYVFLPQSETGKDE